MSSVIPNPATTDWVPINARAANLIYRGGWSSGVTYNDGDVVVGSDGITYVCVKDQTTAAPVPWSTAQLPVKPLYGTTLPTSPVDGQEAILVDSLTNPTYRWRFRYNLGSISAYKWEFIGGTPAEIEVQANENVNTTVGSYLDMATVGPQFTIPRTGEYDAIMSGLGYIGAATGWVNPAAILCLNSSGNWFGGGALVQPMVALNPAAGVTYVSFSYPGRGAATAGDNLKAVYGIIAQGGTGAPQIGRRKLSVTPVRVS